MINIENEEIILEKDSIVEGTVTGVTSFGAFIRLPSNKEGLVHISEIANEYVTDINQHVALNDTVKVKILGLNNKGKYDLSIKKANPSAPQPRRDSGDRPPRPQHNNQPQEDDRPKIATMDRRRAKKMAESGDLNPFESRMLDFLKKSEEKQIDLKRNIQFKQGVKKKKKKK